MRNEDRLDKLRQQEQDRGLYAALQRQMTGIESALGNLAGSQHIVPTDMNIDDINSHIPNQAESQGGPPGTVSSN